MMKMPNLGLGTFRLKGQPLRDSLLQGLDLGYRHIDTAQIYDNEAEVGRLMNESGVPRQDIYLTTKVWISEFGPGKVIPSLELSLEKLGTDYLDLALIHWPSPQDEVPMAVYLEQLAEAKAQGLTREIGVSNFTVAQLQQAIEILGRAPSPTSRWRSTPCCKTARWWRSARSTASPSPPICRWPMARCSPSRS